MFGQLAVSLVRFLVAESCLKAEITLINYTRFLASSDYQKASHFGIHQNLLLRILSNYAQSMVIHLLVIQLILDPCFRIVHQMALISCSNYYSWIHINVLL